MSKIIVFAGSARKGGNTELLAKAFAEGAGLRHEVEMISVSDVEVGPCIGCNTCFEREDGSCFQKDDMAVIYEKMKWADIAVFASPVYFYGISAQLKALVDRFHTPMRNTFNIRKLGLILVGAAELPDLFDPIITQYQMILDFFGLEDAGRVLVRGVKDKGDVLGTDGLKRAFEMGKAL